MQLSSGCKRLEHQRTLTADPEGVEDVERVISEPSAPAPAPYQKRRKVNIPQPSPPPRNTQSGNLQCKEPIPNTLRNTPSSQTAQERIITQLPFPSTTDNPTPSLNLLIPKRKHHPPDNQNTTRNLHQRGDHRRAHDAKQTMQDLEHRERLRAREQRVVDFVEDIGQRAVLRYEVEGVEGAGGPGG